MEEQQEALVRMFSTEITLHGTYGARATILREKELIL
jgi:hypothetical protein